MFFSFFWISSNINDFIIYAHFFMYSYHMGTGDYCRPQIFTKITIKQQQLKTLKAKKQKHTQKKLNKTHKQNNTQTVKHTHTCIHAHACTHTHAHTHTHTPFPRAPKYPIQATGNPNCQLHPRNLLFFSVLHMLDKQRLGQAFSPCPQTSDMAVLHWC